VVGWYSSYDEQPTTIENKHVHLFSRVVYGSDEEKPTTIKNKHTHSFSRVVDCELGG